MKEKGVSAKPFLFQFFQQNKRDHLNHKKEIYELCTLVKVSREWV